MQIEGGLLEMSVPSHGVLTPLIHPSSNTWPRYPAESAEHLWDGASLTLREAGACHPSASMVELFPLFFLVFLWRCRMSLAQGARLSHECGFGSTGRLSSKPFMTAGLALGCPWKICHPEKHIFPWCHRSDTVPQLV